LIVGTAKDMEFYPKKKCSKGFLRTYSITNQGALTFLHKTEVEDVPLAVKSFYGRVIVGMGTHLRLYELGKKKLLRKCEFNQLPNCIVDLQIQGHRVLVSDIQESVHYVAYRPSDNRFIIFADDSTPRYVTCTTMLDYNTVAGGDKFGNLFVNRIPNETSEEVDDDPTGTRMLYKRGYLHGAACKVSVFTGFLGLHPDSRI
jgi:splicing factor 3B subunit 3